MEALRDWMFSICSAMVICGIVLQIMPKTNLEKVFKLVISVFILCILLSPIIIQIPHMNIELEEYSSSIAEEKSERLREVMEKQMHMAAEQRAEKIIADKLLQMGINYHSIAININTNGQSQTVESVDIVLDENMRQQHEKTIARLENALQMDVRLDYTEKE